MNPANTSRTFAECGHCAADNRITEAEFRCTACGTPRTPTSTRRSTP
ncbi:transposase [Nonomuraea polychroma]|nr:transposase [Nonomuraea polychroma]